MKKQIIKALSFITVFALCVSMFIPFGYSEAKAAEKKVKLNKKKITLTTGDWKKLKLKNLDYEIDDIEWSTTDKAVAKVSRKGWVVALVKGECTIKAKVKATGKTYKCKVTVNAPDMSKRVIDPEKPIIALSFALIETFLYVIREDSYQLMSSLALLRNFTTIPLHITCGIVMGYYVSISKFLHITSLDNSCLASSQSTFSSFR